MVCTFYECKVRKEYYITFHTYVRFLSVGASESECIVHHSQQELIERNDSAF